MQTIIQHMSRLLKTVTLASKQEWSLNYGIQSILGGADRFEPIMEGRRS
jgi:hypothetical protein